MLHNREAPHGNALCHESAVERAYDLHRDRLRRAKATCNFRKKPERFAFLEGQISKKFLDQQRSQRIVRDNIQLLQRLRFIEASSKKRQKDRPQQKNKIHERKSDDIEKKNQVLAKRLHHLKPHYSTKAWALQRRKEQVVLRLRKTNRTVGHLMGVSRETTAGPRPDLKASVFASQSYLDGSLMTSIQEKLPPRKQGLPSMVSQVKEKKQQSVKNKQNKFGGSSDCEPLLTGPGSLSLLETERNCCQPTTPTTTTTTEPIATTDDEPTTIKEQRQSTSYGSAHVVYEVRRDYRITPSGSTKAERWPCCVRVSAQEPYTILTELQINVRRQGSDEIITKRAMSISQAAVDYDCSEHVSSSEFDDAYDLQEMLLNMFHEADIDGNGMLSHDEFLALMEDADLGLSDSERQIIFSEIDEDDDTEINYEEFMPVAIDLIQSFQARRYAKRVQNSIDERIEEETLRVLKGPEVAEAVKMANALFSEADPRRSMTLSRPEFRRCLKHPGVQLTRGEQAMLLASVPVDAFGKVLYKKFDDIVYKIKFSTIKHNIFEAEASVTEKLLLELCRDQEKLSMDPDYDRDDPVYSGHVTNKQLRSAVLSDPSVGLTRLQLNSIISDAEIVDSMVDYFKFIPLAAKTIDKMHDPSVVAAKTTLLAKGLSGQAQAMNGKTEADLGRELNELFDLYDTDKSGSLDPTEFACCMEALELSLTKGQVDVLLVTADKDKNGIVDRNEFMDFTFAHLVPLMKDRRLAIVRHDIKLIAEGRVGEIDLSSFDDSGQWFHGVFDDLKSPSWDPATVQAHRELVMLFRKANASKEGQLTSSEFHRVLDALDLALTSYQKARLFSEADEDEDGYISYAEFVPIITRFLQTYRAKQGALSSWASRVAAIDEKVDVECSMAKVHLIESIHIVEKAFQEAGKMEAALFMEQTGSPSSSPVPFGGSVVQEKKKQTSSNDPLTNSPAATKAALALKQKILQKRANVYKKNDKVTFSGVDSPTQETRRPSLTTRKRAMSSSNFPRLTRPSFLRCLATPHAKLSQGMIDGIASRMPALQTDGLTSTSKFQDVVYAVFRDLAHHRVVESLPTTSTLDTHIRTMLRDKEKDARKKMLKGTYGGSIDNAQHSKRGGSRSSITSAFGDDDNDKEDAASDASSLDDIGEVEVKGIMPAKDAHQSFTRAKHLRLSRQQLLSVMSLVDACAAPAAAKDADPVFKDFAPPTTSSPKNEGDKKPNGLILTTKLASCAALVIADLFDVEKLKVRTALARSAQRQSATLLAGDQQDTLIRVLRELFAKRELQVFGGASTNASGNNLSTMSTVTTSSVGSSQQNSSKETILVTRGVLPVHDFCAILRCLPLVDLSRTEVSTIMSHVPYDEHGNILWSDFLHDDAAGVFTTIDKERRQKRTGSPASFVYNLNDPNSNVQPLERSQVTRLCKDLIAQSRLNFVHDQPQKRCVELEFERPCKTPTPVQPAEKQEPRVIQTALPTSGQRRLSFCIAPGGAALGERPVTADDVDKQRRPSLDCETKRDVPVVNELDQALASDGGLLPDRPTLERRKPQPMTYPSTIYVKQTDYQKIQVILETISSKMMTYKADLRLPSLAAVDPDSGDLFLKNVIRFLRIERHSQTGMERLLLLPSAAKAKKDGHHNNNSLGTVTQARPSSSSCSSSSLVTKKKMMTTTTRAAITTSTTTTTDL